MDINKVLDEVRQKLKLSSDYQLSKSIGISEQDLSKYRRGLKVPDAYACFRIAEILEDSPSRLIARVQAENQKNPDKALYFKRFFSIAGLWIVLGVLSAGFGTFSGNVQASGNSLETRADYTYKPIMRSRIMLFVVRRWLVKVAVFCRYCTCNWTRTIRYAD